MMTLTLKRNMSLPARQATMGFCDPRIKQIMEREGSKALELGKEMALALAPTKARSRKEIDALTASK